MKTVNQPLIIRPLGGLGEIGLNCMAFEYDNEIIVVDCGVMFSDLQILGIEFAIPDMTYLIENAHKISGYIITHGHEDHIGALPFALKKHPAPIYCTEFARKLVEAKLEEHGLLSKTDFHTISAAHPFSFKNFKVAAHPVNHSIVESMALFIDTPVGKIVFTGDFKIDPNPYYGKALNPKPFIEAGDQGVTLLMSDSTNVEREGHSQSEERIFHKFDELFQNNTGLTIIAVFASNIARIGQVLELAEKHGLKVALMGRSMEQNAKIAHSLGYLKNFATTVIPLEAIDRYPRHKCIVLSTGSQGEYRSALVRIANGEHKFIKLADGDRVIMSSKFIPGNEKAIGRMINSLFKLGADVLYESVADIHVSGHANSEELTKMLEYTRPKFFIPVHGEYRHLVKHKRLAINTNVKNENAIIAVNGDVLELTPDRLTLVDHIEENRVFIESGETPKNIDRTVIKDRRKIAEAGVVFSVIVYNKTSGKVMSSPELLSRGLFEPGQEGDLLERAKEVVLAIITDVQNAGKHMDLAEEVRIGLRRYFNSRLGKKPIVMPVVIEI